MHLEVKLGIICGYAFELEKGNLDVRILKCLTWHIGSMMVQSSYFFKEKKLKTLI